MTTYGEGNGTPLQYSCLENPMDGGAQWATVHGIAKSRTRLCGFTSTFRFHALEKELATHSSVLAWRIPGTGEPGGLLSMGSHRVGHDWSDLAAAAAMTTWVAADVIVIYEEEIYKVMYFSWGFPSVSVVKTLPAVQEMGFQSMGQEDPLEESIATHSSILVWRIPRTEEPGGLQPIGSQRVRCDGSDWACMHSFLLSHSRKWLSQDQNSLLRKVKFHTLKHYTQLPPIWILRCRR